MRVPSILVAIALMVAIPTVVTRADDGLRMLPASLLQTANTWIKAQAFSGLDVTGQQQGQQGTTDGCHLTYAGSAGFFECIYAGVAWRPIFLDSSSEVHGANNSYQGVIFQGTGGFAVLNSPQTMSKLSAAPTSAPGAGKTMLFFVAGTVAGSCKLQALAGTSTTPLTIADNIGSGC